MVYNFKVFKKCAPNGKITLYMGKRDFVDHISAVEPIDGVILIDEEYTKGRKVYGQVVCTFRYGREEDEVMGLNFHKELFLASEQLFPPPEKREANLTKLQEDEVMALQFHKELILASEQLYPSPEKREASLTNLQERLLKKLGPGAFPFNFTLPVGSPGSVILQQGLEDDGEPCGVQYYVKIFVGDSEIDRSHRRSTVALGIRKIQYAPAKQGNQPCTVVRKDFLLSPGELELEVTLDKQLYLHNEQIGVNICVRNNSNKPVKKIKASVHQGVDVVLFANGQFRNIVASCETEDGCPIQPGSCVQKTLFLTPSLQHSRDKRGIALDGQIKRENTSLASTTLLMDPEQRDAFGIIVSYTVKVKLYLGAMNGELVAELPFIMMHSKPDKQKLIHADSQVDVEMFRQDTVFQQESVDVY